MPGPGTPRGRRGRSHSRARPLWAGRPRGLLLLLPGASACDGAGIEAGALAPLRPGAMPAANGTGTSSRPEPAAPEQEVPGERPLFSAATYELLALLVATIGMLGLCNNLLVLVLYYKFKRLRTPTNLFLVNISLSDLLVSVFGVSLTFMSCLRSRWVWDAAGCVWDGFSSSLFGGCWGRGRRLSLPVLLGPSSAACTGGTAPCPRFPTAPTAPRRPQPLHPPCPSRRIPAAPAGQSGPGCSVAALARGWVGGRRAGAVW